MSAATPFPVVVTFPVHWGEMDALGHVNNARFFAWFESARIALFQRIGVLADRPRDIGPILATTSCDFIRPVRYPCTVSVGARVANVGRTSLTMEYAVWSDGRPDDLCAKGASVAVLVDYATMQKVPVPAEVRARIDALTPPSGGGAKV
jgi:acyl-CoA thioester hydrolase